MQLARGKDEAVSPSLIPDGYTLVRNVVLPEHKAVIVNEWGKMTAKELKKQ